MTLLFPDFLYRKPAPGSRIFNEDGTPYNPDYVASSPASVTLAFNLKRAYPEAIVVLHAGHRPPRIFSSRGGQEGGLPIAVHGGYLMAEGSMPIVHDPPLDASTLDPRNFKAVVRYLEDLALKRTEAGLEKGHLYLFIRDDSPNDYLHFTPIILPPNV